MEEAKIIAALQSPHCSENSRQGAFSTLHSQFQTKIKSYISHLLNRRMDDEVVCSISGEAFTKAFLKINTFSPQYPFWPWLKQISLNSVRDYLRTRKRQTGTRAEYNELSNPIRNLQDSSSADSQIICNEQLKYVKLFFEQLPPKHREVMKLRFLQYKSYAEIEAELQVNSHTISTIILRCRAKLKTYLNCL